MANYKRIIEVAALGVSNPDAFIRPAMEGIDEALDNGFNVVTPNNPLLNLIEASSSITVAGMVAAENLTKKQYKLRATTYDDLYGHMSDRDFAGRFSTPGRTAINMALPYQWIVSNAVTDPDTGHNVIYMPKDTIVTVEGIDLYWHHDIKIHVLASGDVQVGFVLNRESPINTPTTINLDTREVYLEGERLVDITIPVDQLSLDIRSGPITANGFNVNISLTDKFYYARAFTKVAGTWREIATTHSDQVYDPSNVTMTLKVTDTLLEASIPDIYINNGTAGTEAMLLIYTTRGNINTSLANFNISDYSVVFNDAFNDNAALWAPLSTNPLKLIYSVKSIADGSNGLTFEQLRDRIVYNNYDEDISVSFDKLTESMNSRGYGIYKQKDTISERTFVTTRAIPAPADNFISTGPSVTNKDVVIDTTRNDVAKYMAVNGDVATLKPGALFKSTGFDVILASTTEQTQIEALGDYDLCDKLNEEQWFYTPFHYVLDSSKPNFRADAYYLEKPQSLTRSFVNFNPNIEYAVRTTNAAINFNDGTWTIVITASHPTGLTGLHLQMKYTTFDNKTLHINSTQTVVNDTESTFTFVLNSNLLIDENHRLFTDSFFDGTNTQQDAYIDLESVFEYIYLIEEDTVTPSSFDAIIETAGITATVSGVTYDRINFKLGNSLNNLNVVSKSILQPGQVQLHTTSEKLTYATDIYELDENGNKAYTLVDGVPQFNILHNVGDDVIVDGVQQYKHLAGDPVLVNGKPVYIEQPYNSNSVRLFLVDAKYKYVTETRAKAYADGIATTVVNYLEDISTYAPQMLERTSLVFEPVSTSNLATVTVTNGRQTTARTDVQFNVRYVMDAGRYSDVQLRNTIIETTKRTIAEAISTTVYSESALVSELDQIASNVMRNVNVSSSLGSEIVSIADDSSRFSMRSRIVPSQNGQLSIEDSIDVEITT